MKPAGRLVVFTILIPWLVLAALAAPYPVTMEPRLRLELQPVAVMSGNTRTFESRTLEIDPVVGGSIRLDLAWPLPDRASRIDLHFTGSPTGAGQVHDVRVQSSVTVPGSDPVLVDRQTALDEGSLRFLEIYAKGERHLTLALKVESILKPVVLKPTGRELPVNFRLEVSRVTEQGVVPLETDTLHTIIGQQVEYFFRRGRGGDLETVRLELTPLSIRGDMLEVQFKMQGEIRTAASPLFLSRKETLFTGRSTVNEFRATTGDPPLGYLFSVIPVF
ncbi:MAG: hypothetical protein IFK94_06250 [Acidobacteria bacterium]|uniref:Uncharacterized protein n=1 Tax=Candidatus Polarisedimenticola svalbardensis TaxID=2886004 RepID=A0A8J6Y7V5_9BACT|nr:hypothetical protein [Candidatus Polarisedimenticola svalbardensis]